jgi:hypothetical protein
VGSANARWRVDGLYALRRNSPSSIHRMGPLGGEDPSRVKGDELLPFRDPDQGAAVSAVGDWSPHRPLVFGGGNSRLSLNGSASECDKPSW